MTFPVMYMSVVAELRPCLWAISFINFSILSNLSLFCSCWYNLISSKQVCVCPAVNFPICPLVPLWENPPSGVLSLEAEACGGLLEFLETSFPSFHLDTVACNPSENPYGYCVIVCIYFQDYNALPKWNILWKAVTVVCSYVLAFQDHNTLPK